MDAWKLISNANCELITLELKPNESIEKHINPKDVIFYTLSGKGVLLIEEKEFNLSKGECIEVAKGLNRTWLNKGIESLILLVIKSN